MAIKGRGTPALDRIICSLIILGLCMIATNADEGYQHVDLLPKSDRISDIQLVGLSVTHDRVRRQAGSPTPVVDPTPLPPVDPTPATVPTPAPQTPATVPTPATRATTTSTKKTSGAPTKPSTAKKVASTTPTTPAATGPSSTIVLDENHDYYSYKVYHGSSSEAMWMDETTMSDHGKTTHSSLSDSHRVAATIPLSFAFQFYGHMVSQLTVATGGFVYASDFLHQWLTATQYIAPLMANFDTTVGNTSNIHYADAGTFFIVWWQDVILQDFPQAGSFNFQTIIHEDGRIVFNYKQVPVDISMVPKGLHPVKIGLSDAYYIDTVTETNTKRRTIYEYHRVDIDVNKISNHTSVVIHPLPTCVEQTSCSSCVSAQIHFTCGYCAKINRCSDGIDRHRQVWLDNGCQSEKVSVMSECADSTSPQKMTSKKFAGGLGIGGLVAIIIILALVFALTFVAVYGYLNPQTKLGMWMIEHRPSQIRQQLSNVKFFNRGEGTSADKYQVSMSSGETVA